MTTYETIILLSDLELLSHGTRVSAIVRQIRAAEKRLEIREDLRLEAALSQLKRDICKELERDF